MNRLRELRHEKGITMKAFGRIFGLAESTISQYETGKRQPDNGLLIKFANYYNVSVDYILGNEQKNKAVKNDSLDADRAEAKKIIDDLPEGKRRQAIDYLRYLAASSDNPNKK